MNKIKNRLVNFLFLGLSCVPFREETNKKTCKLNKTNQSKTHYMRFNGKKYDFKHLNFLDYGI